MQKRICTCDLHPWWGLCRILMISNGIGFWIKVNFRFWLLVVKLWSNFFYLQNSLNNFVKKLLWSCTINNQKLKGIFKKITKASISIIFGTKGSYWNGLKIFDQSPFQVDLKTTDGSSTSCNFDQPPSDWCNKACEYLFLEHIFYE